MKTYSVILIAILTLSSCVKSKEESELEKTKLELADRTKADEQTRVYEQKSNLGKQKKLAEMNEQLLQFPAELAQAEVKLKDTHQQLNEINSYENKHKNEIAQLQDSDSFDFLKSPKSLMNYIFKSAKSGDFSNFHYLCDPYAKNDGDTKEICSMQMLTKEQKEEFMASFANGKIIGEPKIIGDKAEVEFEFGPTSSKRETMNLINRNGLWYLDSF